MDITTWFIYALVVGIILVAIASFAKLKGQKNMLLAFALGFILVFGYAAYIGDISLEPGTEPATVATSGIPVNFDWEISVNGTADTFDNSSEDDTSFTTPFMRNTTGHTMTTTASTAAVPVGFHDPVYNITITPIPTAGVTNDDLVTIKFSANDPGEVISSGGTDYRLIAQDSNSKPYLYWKAIDASDGSTLGSGVQIQSGSATFLYTDTVYLWLNVVYQDSGCSRMTDFTTKSFTITLSNVDGSWTDTIPVSVMPIGSHT